MFNPETKDYFAGRGDRERLACPHCDESHMHEPFMIQANVARAYAKTPFIVNSGYRCKVHNEAIGGVKNSSHVRGVAMDIKCKDIWVAFRIIKGLILAGFERIFLYVKEVDGKLVPNHIHFDDDTKKGIELFGIRRYKD